jgi:hypothetical protein
MKRRYMAILIPYLPVAICYVALVLFPTASVRITREDGPIETLGASLFLTGAAIAFACWFLSGRQVRETAEKQASRNAFFFFLGLVLFIAFAEEISWGQRLFGWQTRGLFKDANLQGETNLHNLSFLHGDHPDGSLKTGVRAFFTAELAFLAMWVVYIVLIPLMARTSEKSRALILRINLPIPPLWVSGLFGTNFLLARLSASIISMRSGHATVHSLVEVEEMLCAYTLALLSASLLGRLRSEDRA